MTHGNDTLLRSLLDRFRRNGDVGAMEELVGRTRPRLLAAARRIGNPGDAEDTVQTAYHSLLARAGKPMEAPVLPWLLVATVRIAYRRKAVAVRAVALAERLARDARAEPPDRGAMREETREFVRAEVARLPARYRDAVVLHHLQGLSVGEVARLLAVPEGTVKTWLHRGRRLLRSRLPTSLIGAATIVPWVLADGLRRSVAAWTAGGAILTGKAVATGVLVVAGVAAIGLSLSGRDGGDGPSPRERPATARTGRAADASRADARGARAPAESRDLPVEGRAGASAGAGEAPPLRREVVVAAEALGVPLETVRLARHALSRLIFAGLRSGQPEVARGFRAEAARAFEELAEDRERAFLAGLALVRGGTMSPELPEYFRRIAAPGDIPLLIRDAYDPSRPAHVRLQVILVLGDFDRSEVREALLDLAARAEEPALIVAAAQSLGRLGEERGARVLGPLLADPAYVHLRRDLLSALGAMGGEEAKRWIVSHLRSPDGRETIPALAALDRISPATAQGEAARILASPRAAELTETERLTTEAFAGR